MELYSSVRPCSSFREEFVNLHGCEPFHMFNLLGVHIQRIDALDVSVRERLNIVTGVNILVYSCGAKR